MKTEKWCAEIWVALDEQDRIKATWYRGCVQPHRKWRKAGSPGWDGVSRGALREQR